MIRVGEDDVDSMYLGEEEVVSAYLGEELVWEAANFFLADGDTLRTADGDIFNCKI